MNRSTLTIIIVYAIAIAVVIVGFFLLEIEKTDLNYWALAALIISLAASMVVIVFLIIRQKDINKTFSAAGLTTAIVIYQIAVIVSVLFVQAFKDNTNRFALLEIVIMAVFAVVTIVILNMSKRVHEKDELTLEKKQSGEYNEPKRGGF